MLHQPSSPRQHSALCTPWQSLLELSWAIHCLVTSAKRSGDLTEKSLFLCTAHYDHPTAPWPPCAIKMNRKYNRRKEQSSICRGFHSSRFSFTFHSSPCQAGLDSNWNSLILPWLPLSSKDIGESLSTSSLQHLQHLKYNWQMVWWIQLSHWARLPCLC